VTMAPPNKRLKLTGARKQGRIALPPWLAFFCRSSSLRRRARRPQLKRDPLGCAQLE